MLYTVSFYRKLPHNGKMEKVTLRGVASWQDEASSVDPYTLRVIRDAGGNVVAGPMLGEILDWQAQPGANTCNGEGV